MDTTAYQEKMAALGIQRGALAEGFPLEDGTCTEAFREPTIYHRALGERVSAAPAPEDLTHLNPRSSGLIQRMVRERWAKLDRRESSERNRRNGSGGVEGREGRGSRA